MPRTCGSARRACASWPPAARTSTRPPSIRTRTSCPLLDGMTLLALIGIVDPPRPSAKKSIAEAHGAGMQVRMITGDHAVTAEAIAQRAGHPRKAITGAEFRAMSDEEALTRDRQHRRHRPGRARGQGPPRGHPPQEGPHRGHDRRWRERRPGPEAGRHRRGDGHHRHGGLEGGRQHDPDRRQLRDHRERRRARPRPVRQPEEVHPLPDRRPDRLHHPVPGVVASSTSWAACRSCRSRPCS